jgi:large subunit ribosomal protein L27
MAHKTATASKATQKGNVAGKRLGVKLSHGQGVKTGQIIVRQRGRTFIPGDNVKMAKDFTLYSMANGKVNFANTLSRRKEVNVKQ